MFNQVDQGYEEKMEILISCILKTVHYRVYKCIAILHTPTGRTHGESSISSVSHSIAKTGRSALFEFSGKRAWPYNLLTRSLRSRERINQDTCRN